MNSETGHIFSGGEQVMRDRAQQQLAEAQNLLNEPLAREDVRQALRRSRAAVAALEYLDRIAAGQPAPRRD
jgi:hypothetical protein